MNCVQVVYLSCKRDCVCVGHVWVVCVSSVCGLCVWIACVDCVYGLCVWIACVDGVCVCESCMPELHVCVCVCVCVCVRACMRVWIAYALELGPFSSQFITLITKPPATTIVCMYELEWVKD